MKPPAFFEPIVFGLLLSGLMSLVVSGIATWNALGNALGFVPNFAPRWLESWLFAWVIAFPSVLVIAPLVRRITHTVVTRPAPN